MSDIEPIAFRPRGAWGSAPDNVAGAQSPGVTRFNRHELNEILAVYGRKVAAGDWRDYAIEMGRDRAVFAVYRRASEFPIYRIEKTPKLARKQGAFSVVAAGGLILKRGNELRQVLGVLEKAVRVVS